MFPYTNGRHNRLSIHTQGAKFCTHLGVLIQGQTLCFSHLHFMNEGEF